MKNKNQAVMVEREPYTKNNKNYFAYFVRGNIRGRRKNQHYAP